MIKMEVAMDNEELLKEIDERFKSHMGVLLEQHKQEIQIVGECHSTLLRKINDLNVKVEEGQKITETRLDRMEGKIDRVEKKLDTTIKQNDQRFKKIEQKIGI